MLVQGPRHVGDALAAAAAGRHRRARGLVGQRRRVGRVLRGGGRAARDDHGAVVDEPGEDGADESARRARRAHPGEPAGDGRRGGGPRRAAGAFMRDAGAHR